RRHAKKRKTKTNRKGATQVPPSKQEETELAIELAAQELRKNPKLTRDHLYDRLFGSKDKGAPSLKKKNWVTAWSKGRFRYKVWPRARERAGLDSARPGRPKD